MSERKRASGSTGSPRGSPSRHVCELHHSAKRKVPASRSNKQLKAHGSQGNVRGRQTTRTNKLEISTNRAEQLDNRMASGGEQMNRLTGELTAGENENNGNVKYEIPPNVIQENVDNYQETREQCSTGAGVIESIEYPEDGEGVVPDESQQVSLMDCELSKLCYDRTRLLTTEDEVMASSIVCTDGSDVEVLTDDKDLLDFIEVVDSDRESGTITEAGPRPKKADSEIGSSWSSGNLEKTFDDKLVMSDGNSDIASPPVPVDALVTVHNDSESECLLPTASGDIDATAHMRLDRYDYVGSGSSAPPSGATSDDEITPVSQGYDLMADLDSMANGGISRPDSLSLPHLRRRQLARSESESSSWSDICSHHSSTEALIEAATVTPLHAQGNVTREGDMIAFVTEDLTEKIRMSSPLARKGMYECLDFTFYSK